MPKFSQRHNRPAFPPITPQRKAGYPGGDLMIIQKDTRLLQEKHDAALSIIRNKKMCYFLIVSIHKTYGVILLKRAYLYPLLII